MRLIRETNYDFMSKRYIAFAFSLAIIVPGLISMVAHGGLNQGVDFTGGVQVDVQLLPKSSAKAEAPIEGVRTAVAAAGYDNRSIQKTGGGMLNDFLIHVQGEAKGSQGEASDAGAKRIAEQIVGKVQAQFPDFDAKLQGY